MVWTVPLPLRIRPLTVVPEIQASLELSGENSNDQPLGTLVSFPFMNRISSPALGVMLALSAGALVYVGASHLLPAVEKENKRYSILALAAGVLVAVIIVVSKA